MASTDDLEVMRHNPRPAENTCFVGSNAAYYFAKPVAIVSNDCHPLATVGKMSVRYP